MSGLPDLTPWLLTLLTLSLLVSTVQLSVQRRWGMLLAQPLLIALLAAILLWKPEKQNSAIALITDGATQEQISTLRKTSPGMPLIALPGAIASADVIPAADLAGVLRQQPTSLLVVGDGLDATELAQLRDTRFEFRPSEWQSAAITDLKAPGVSAPGERWVVEGSVQQVDAADTVTLLDPAGASVDQTNLKANGRFTLSAQTPLNGDFVYHLELRRADQVLDRLSLSVRIAAAQPGKAMLLASTPSPELKFLRRWAADAGLDLDSRITVAPGLALRRGNAALSAASLAELDLLIVDEASWRQLGSQKEMVIDAVRAGMGLLWRVGETPTVATLAEWKSLGIPAEVGGELPIEVDPPSFMPRLAPGTSLHRWPIDITSAQPVTSAASLGSSAWTSIGQGRVAITWLIDAYQYVQQGHADVYATHWATLWHTLARPDKLPDAWSVMGLPVAGKRVVVCNHDHAAQAAGLALIGPDDQHLQGVSDPHATGCIGFWPRQPGAWRLQPSISRSTTLGADPRLIQVFDQAEVRSLLRADKRSRTAVAAARPSVEHVPARAAAAEHLLRALMLASWFLLAWALWWWERRALMGSAALAEFAPSSSISTPGHRA